MMLSPHGWGWQPPQTASHSHLRHIQSVWAHLCAVHGHKVAALNSYTHTTWVIFWGSGSLVETKWCHYIMVEADSQLKLLPVSTLDIYKLFKHIHIMSIAYGSSLKKLYQHYLTQNLGYWVTCRVKIMSLRHDWSWQPTQTASPSIFDIYKVFEHIHILSMGIWQ